MSSRSYLSIGDVLTLLRQEFPDVTISKIRFLESQGLVNPERTPSGYRKFYEHDVERLRWVLRQQREHFLPLKVIKDRLDEDGGADADAPAAPDPPVSEVHALPTVAADPAVAGPPRLVTVPDRTVVVEDEPGPATREPAARHRARATVGATVAPGTAASAQSGPSGRAPRTTAARGDVQVGNGVANGSGGRIEPTASAAKHDKPAKATPPAAPVAPATPPPVASGGGPDDPPAVALGSLGGASLTMEDLCAASGLTVEEVVELQEYGLLSATVAAGVEFFDEDALTVASLAAKFAAFGIEARHLRLYKNAADREAGFVEQIVIPLVRQRNPEARARATQTAEDLARLGQQLRGSLLRTALRELLAP